MPRKKATDLRELNEDELEARLGEEKQNLFTLRFQLVTGQQENTARIGHTKKQIARIETILRQREIEAAEAAEATA